MRPRPAPAPDLRAASRARRWPCSPWRRCSRPPQRAPRSTRSPPTASTRTTATSTRRATWILATARTAPPSSATAARERASGTLTCRRGARGTDGDDGGDGGDGSADGPIEGGGCAGQCPPGAPFGWEAPAIVYMGPESSAPPCPADAPIAGYEGHADLNAPSVCDTCACSPPAGACVLPATLTANTSTCPGTAPGTAHVPFDSPSHGTAHARRTTPSRAPRRALPDLHRFRLDSPAPPHRERLCSSGATRHQEWAHHMGLLRPRLQARGAHQVQWRGGRLRAREPRAPSVHLPRGRRGLSGRRALRGQARLLHRDRRHPELHPVRLRRARREQVLGAGHGVLGRGVLAVALRRHDHLRRALVQRRPRRVGPREQVGGAGQVRAGSVCSERGEASGSAAPAGPATFCCLAP